MPSFPTFAAGESVHVPFTQTVEFFNVSNRRPHGWQYSYNVLAAGIKQWVIQFSLSDSDLTTLQTFWDARKGAYEEFDFTDPDTGVTTSKCRFAQDALIIEQAGPNENLVTVQIQEYK